VAVLEVLDQSFAVWKPEVESSFSSLKLNLIKLNSFFYWEAKVAGNPQARVLSMGSAATRSFLGPSIDSSNGHRINNNHRDHGFRRVFTQIHDPVTSTIPQSHSSPNF
jgi:hypothetical protein